MKTLILLIVLLFSSIIESKKYTYSNTGYKMYYHRGHPKYVHRENYKKHYGSIPKNYEVHHIDHNKYNNHPKNLIALSKKEHRKLHRNY